MNKRLVQLLGDGTEELWYFPENITDEEIKTFYFNYITFADFDSFEEYMESEHSEIDSERVFVDEIIVD